MFKRDGIWWVSITFRGRRIRRSTETSGLELAKAIESKLRTELIEEKYFDKCAGAEKTFKKTGISWVMKNFIIARGKAGLEDFRFHDLRHTFATRLAQRGVDLYTISKLPGHVNITMTARYAHHCPESLRAGIAVLENSGHDLVMAGEIRNVSNA